MRVMFHGLMQPEHELLSEQLESFSFRSFEFIISDSFEIFFYDCILFSPGRFLEHVCTDY